jgi:hypothetical protein
MIVKRRTRRFLVLVIPRGGWMLHNIKSMCNNSVKGQLFVYSKQVIQSTSDVDKNSCLIARYLRMVRLPDTSDWRSALWVNTVVADLSFSLFHPKWIYITSSDRLCFVTPLLHLGTLFSINVICYCVCVGCLSASFTNLHLSNVVFHLHIWAILILRTVTHYLHGSTLVSSVRHQNVIRSKSHLNCSRFPNLKPSFPKISVDWHSTHHYSRDGMCSRDIVS